MLRKTLRFQYVFEQVISMSENIWISNVLKRCGSNAQQVLLQLPTLVTEVGQKWNGHLQEMHSHILVIFLKGI